MSLTGTLRQPVLWLLAVLLFPFFLFSDSARASFEGPIGIEIDAADNIYVLEAAGRISKFSPDYALLGSWGSAGTGDGQFKAPGGLAIGPNGNIYVADKENNRIQVFTADGAFVTKWGSEGAAPGQFKYPGGVTVSNAGEVFVADTTNHRIQKFTADGTYLGGWGSFGAANGQFNDPRDVALDQAGNAYVTDSGRNRIQKFTSDGTWLLAWGGPGQGNSQFNTPWGITVDRAGIVYVVDAWNHRVQRFDSNGTYLGQWGTFGVSEGSFGHPRGVALDSAGNVYVADYHNRRVQVLTFDGVLIAVFGGEGVKGKPAGPAPGRNTKASPPPRVIPAGVGYYYKNRLYIRVLCPARFRPNCRASAVAVTAKRRGRAMTRATRLQVPSKRWKRGVLVVKPAFRARMQALSKVKRKTIHVRITIRSARGKKKGTVYHRLRVRTA